MFHRRSGQWGCIWRISATEAWGFVHPWIMGQHKCDPAQTCEDDPTWSSPLLEWDPWAHPLGLGTLLPFQTASSLLFLVHISYICGSWPEFVARNWRFSLLDNLSSDDFQAVRVPSSMQEWMHGGDKMQLPLPVQALPLSTLSSARSHLSNATSMSLRRRNKGSEGALSGSCSLRMDGQRSTSCSALPGAGSVRSTVQSQDRWRKMKY